MSDDRLYLVHIRECIARVEDYTAEGKDQFLSDTKTHDAVLRNLQTLSESTQRLSDSFTEEHDEINWSAISGFRNVLVHNYLGINLERVWEVVQADIPALKRVVCFELGESIVPPEI